MQIPTTSPHHSAKNKIGISGGTGITNVATQIKELPKEVVRKTVSEAAGSEAKKIEKKQN